METDSYSDFRLHPVPDPYSDSILDADPYIKNLKNTDPKHCYWYAVLRTVKEPFLIKLKCT